MSADTDPATVALPAAAVPSRADAGPEAGAVRPPLVMRLAALLKREPVLVVTLAYALVSFMGMWSNYWFYRRLGVPILDYLQGSDLFVIGLRRPDYFLVVLAVVAFVALVGMPVRWFQRNPGKAEAMRARRPWLYWFLTGGKWMSGRRMRAETQMAAFALVLSLQYLWIWSVSGAVKVLDGEWDGQQVQLTLAGDTAPLPGQAQLLGTTSAYVMVWWPGERRVEVLPVANVGRIQSALPVRERGSRGVEAVAPTPLSDAPARSAAPALAAEAPVAAAATEADPAAAEPVAVP